MKISKNCLNKKGITLIALVITIIVLLILAGVSVATLTGENGVLKQAENAKNKTDIATEEEAVKLTVISKQMDNNNSVDYLGIPLYTKSLETSNRWVMISINETKETYGTGWYYIEKDTELESYGKTKYEWLVKYETGEVIRLEENGYVKLSYDSGLAVTDGLVFNVDSTNMTTGDVSSWGEGVELYGFDEISESGISFDGVDDYITFKAGSDFERGFSFSFYGRIYEVGSIFTKQKENNAVYSCRFIVGEDLFRFNTSKNRTDSEWAINDNENNGILDAPCTYTLGEIGYFDVTFDPEKNQFVVYQDGSLMGTTVVNENYWHGENGGKQIFEDDTINCYIGRGYGADLEYVQAEVYSLRLYNRSLTSQEVKDNYEATTAYHSLLD